MKFFAGGFSSPTSILSRLFLTFLSFFLLAAPLAAQETQQAQTQSAEAEQAAAGVDPQQLEELIGILEDPVQREAFLGRLRTLSQVQQEQAQEEEEVLTDTLMAAASNGIEELSVQLDGVLDYIQQVPAMLDSAYAALQEPDMRRAVLEISAKVVGTFVLAMLGGLLTRLLLARPRKSLQGKAPQGPISKIMLLVASLILKLIPLAGFVAVAYLVLPLIDPRPVTRVVLLTLVNANVIAQAAIILAYVVLSVDNPAMRAYPVKDETAAYCYVWIRRLTLVTVYGYFIMEALLLVGLDPALHGFLVDLVGLLVAMLIISLILQTRGAVAGAIRGGAGTAAVMTQVRATAAMLWHLLAIAYVLGVYIVWAAEVEGGFSYLLTSSVLTLVVVAVMRVCLLGTDQGLARLFHVPERIRQQHPGLENRAGRYRPAIARVVKILITAVGLLAILEAWGVNATAFMATDSGRELVAGLVRIGLIIAASFLLWEIISAFIEKQLKKRANSSRRTITLLPVLRNLVRLVIIVLGAMIILSELGMDIGPLLASAGVIGLAIGFGAQTLVRDLITGMFVILEDIIAVGDWVEIAGHSGMVEAMSIRTMQLRDLSGDLRVIPFGDVSSVHKVANDYSYALIVIGVAYRESTDEVVTLLQQVGEEMQQDPDWKNIILEPLEIQGVNELGASSVDIRVRFKCKPLEHWSLRREFLRRVKILFDEKGIEIPFPHQTLFFGEDKDGNAPTAHIKLEGDNTGE